MRMPEKNSRIHAFRQKRRRLYELLAAMNTGPLGLQLASQVKQLASELYGQQTWPEISSQASATLFRWDYGFCEGNCDLGCGPNAPIECLPAKFQYLAQSAVKGAKARRLAEAKYISSELLPCLQTNAASLKHDSYLQVMQLCIAVVTKDAHSISENASYS